MDARKPPTAQPLVEEIAAGSSKQRGAGRYVSYRSLLMRNAAVWKRGNRVWFSTAGNDPQKHRLTCVSGSEARKLAGAFATELRKAHSDDEYNAIATRFLAEIRSAWPDNVKVRHVHTCDASIEGKVSVDGRCACSFDWTQHELSADCPCVVEIDSTDESGEWQFVVHRTGYKKKEMVSV